MGIQFGCETYTWLMSGDKYVNRLDHILAIAAQAGFTGVEPTTDFLGNVDDPGQYADMLKEHNMQMSAVCLVEDWLHPKETQTEWENAEKCIAFTKHFPGALLALCQMPASDRENLKDRQQNLLTCVNTISRRATDQGLVCTYHPNSPEGSIYRTAEDYDILMDGLDASVTGWTPDVGHIANGQMDPLETIKKYRQLVNHVHYKDMSDPEKWEPTGAGSIDFEGITSYLRDTGYEGWIIMEDECKQAEEDPDGMTLKDGVYLKEKLLSLV